MKIRTASRNGRFIEQDELRDHLRPPANYIRVDHSLRNILVYTLAKYPADHNPFLSLTLQNQLDAMSSSDFLNYVLTELTLDERESLMVDERQRLKTFLTNWPRENDHGLSGATMARNGFYYLNAGDSVQCVFCRGRLQDWNTGGDVLREHAMAFNFCRFVKGIECGNRVYASKKLCKEDMVNIAMYPDGSHQHLTLPTSIQTVVKKEPDFARYGISTIRAGAIRYAPCATRDRTFARWPASCPVKSKEISEAGFFYTGFDDQVRCFYCSGSIRNWTDGDEPWVEHARWFPDCVFLINTKGQAFVDEVQHSTPQNKKCVRKTVKETTNELHKKEVQSSKMSMVKLCRQLGHSPEVIEQSLVHNGAPFESVGDMIDTIYDIELLDEAEQMNKNPTGNDVNVKVTNSVCPQEELQAAIVQSMETNDVTKDFEQACKNCAKKAHKYVPARHISLPCGHLLFCDKCAQEANERAMHQQNHIFCLHKSCNSVLTGTMRVFFA